MKIAIASAFLGHVLRGVEAWAQDLAAELHRRSMDVTLFQGGGPSDVSYSRYIPCPDHTKPFWKHVTRFTRHGLWRVGLGSPLHLQQVVFARRVARELRLGKFDIVHTQDSGTALILERERLAGRHRAKVILGNGTEEPLDFLVRLEHVQELAPHYLEIDRQKGIPADRQWFAIPNFVDCGLYKPGDQGAAREKFGIPRDRFVVLDVAALKLTHKRVDWLAKEVAIARQKHPDIMLIVAGATTPETPQVEHAVRKFLGEDAWILKNIPREDMPDLYQASDLFAHAALTEMMPIAFLEALATGLPVRGSRFPVIEWIIGDAGICIDMEQPGELALSIIESYENPELRAQRGRNARKSALARFDKPHVVDQIVAMYEAVLQTLKQKPLVSVVIPTYNYGKFICETIESVFAQTYSNIEIIVVDDGSTDDTASRLARYGNRVQYICQKNGGISRARNKGIEAARGELIALLDADDLWLPDKVEKQVALFSELPDSGLIATERFSIDETGQRLGDVTAQSVSDEFQEFTVRDLLEFPAFSPSSVMIHKHTLLAVGGFNEALRGAEDLEIYVRIAARYRVVRLNDILTAQRFHLKSLSHNTELMLQNHSKALDQLFIHVPQLQRRTWLRRIAEARMYREVAFMRYSSGNRKGALLDLLRSGSRWPFALRDLRARKRRLDRAKMFLKYSLARTSGR